MSNLGVGVGHTYVQADNMYVQPGHTYVKAGHMNQFLKNHQLNKAEIGVTDESISD